MNIETVSISPAACDAIFRIVTGARVSITTRTVWRTEQDGIAKAFPGGSYYATATDVYLALNGVPHRLFVDVSEDFGAGMRHIWLTDGPAQIEGMVICGAPERN